MRMAEFLQRDDIHSKARTVLIGSILLVVLTIPLAILTAAVNEMLGILMIAIGVGFLIIFVMYVDVIRQVFKEIAAGKTATARL